MTVTGWIGKHRVGDLIDDVSASEWKQYSEAAWRPCNAATAWTRALVPAVHAPPPDIPIDGTFRWHVEPPVSAEPVTATFYTDGSLIDGSHEHLRRLGWAFVAGGADGTVLASASGVPPPWIDSIGGAEAWAIRMAALTACQDSVFRSDSLGCVTALQRGRQWSTGPQRPLARTMKMLHDLLGDSVSARRIVWMPAHTTPEDIGRRELGNGDKLTTRDRWANDLADGLAKAAARGVRAPLAARAAAVACDLHVFKLALCVGRLTWCANNRPDEPRRDALAPPRIARGGGEDGGMRPPPRGRVTKPDRPPLLGGHVLLRMAGGSWRCGVCWATSARRATLATLRCAGSAVARWAQRELALVSAGGADGPLHRRIMTGPVVWCAICGSYAIDHAVGLSKPCRDPLPTAGSGRRTALNRIWKWQHPKTGAWLDAQHSPEPSDLVSLARGDGNWGQLLAVGIPNVGVSAKRPLAPSGADDGEDEVRDAPHGHPRAPYADDGENGRPAQVVALPPMDLPNSFPVLHDPPAQRSDAASRLAALRARVLSRVGTAPTSCGGSGDTAECTAPAMTLGPGSSGDAVLPQSTNMTDGTLVARGGVDDRGRGAKRGFDCEANDVPGYHRISRRQSAF